jgi:hypothetical protein
MASELIRGIGIKIAAAAQYNEVTLGKEVRRYTVPGCKEYCPCYIEYSWDIDRKPQNRITCHTYDENCRQIINDSFLPKRRHFRQKEVLIHYLPRTSTHHDCMICWPNDETPWLSFLDGCCDKCSEAQEDWKIGRAIAAFHFGGSEEDREMFDCIKKSLDRDGPQGDDPRDV